MNMLIVPLHEHCQYGDYNVFYFQTGVDCSPIDWNCFGCQANCRQCSLLSLASSDCQFEHPIQQNYQISSGDYLQSEQFQVC